MRIKDVLKLIKKDSSTVFLIRHGARFSTPNIDDDWKCTLTPQGQLDAFTLGQLLAAEVGSITKVNSSPIGRCQETALKIIEGNQSPASLEVLQDLEKAYHYNVEEAMVHYRKYRVPEIMKKLLLGERLTGARTVEEGTMRLLHDISKDLTSGKGISLYITHDSVLALFYGTLTGIPIYDIDDEWFTFLDGVCLQYHGDGKIALYRRERVFDITDKINQLDPSYIPSIISQEAEVADIESIKQKLHSNPAHDDKEDIYIPEHLLSALSTIPEDAPCVLLLRHAEREDVKDEESGHVNLTPTGYRQSFALGERLGTKLKWAQSSPLFRAKCTIEEVIKGAHIPPFPIEDSLLLGEPGPFVVDRAQGSKWFTKLGTESLVRKLISGTTFDGINTAKQGTSLFIGYLKNLLQTHTGLGLMISHDAIIIPIIASCTGESFQDKWLRPLDGALIISQSDSLIFYRNYEHFYTDLSILSLADSTSSTSNSENVEQQQAESSFDVPCAPPSTPSDACLDGKGHGPETSGVSPVKMVAYLAAKGLQCPIEISGYENLPETLLNLGSKALTLVTGNGGPAHWVLKFTLEEKVLLIWPGEVPHETLVSATQVGIVVVSIHQSPGECAAAALNYLVMLEKATSSSSASGKLLLEGSEKVQSESPQVTDDSVETCVEVSDSFYSAILDAAMNFDSRIFVQQQLHYLQELLQDGLNNVWLSAAQQFQLQALLVDVRGSLFAPTPPLGDPEGGGGPGGNHCAGDAGGAYGPNGVGIVVHNASATEQVKMVGESQ